MAGKTLEFVSIDRIARDARAANETIERIWGIFKQEPLDKREASIPGMMSEAGRLVLEDRNKREVPIEWHSDNPIELLHFGTIGGLKHRPSYKQWNNY